MPTDFACVMAHVRRRLRVVGIGLAVVGCNAGETVIPAPPAQLLVHAVLNPGVREQVVLLDRVLTGASPAQRCRANQPGYLVSDCIPESGARVTLITPDQRELSAIEDPPDSASGPASGTYRVLLDQHDVSLVPGATYTLRIRTTRNEEVSATTTIPLVTPAVSGAGMPTFNRERDTLRLSWPTGAHVARFELYVQASDVVRFRMYADSTATLAGTLQNSTFDVFLSGSRTTITVFALDSNYYDYYRTTNNIFTGRGLISRIHGGIGVFGAVVLVDAHTFDVQGQR